MKKKICAMTAFSVLVAVCGRAECAKWDPAPAMKNAIMDTNGVNLKFDPAVLKRVHAEVIRRATSRCPRIRKPP